MALSPQRILIVGGGIAGCSAGIALASAGHCVRIIEAQTEWRFQSSGIFVYANGLSCLDDLGVLDAILETGFAVPEGRNAYFDHTGAEITATTYPTAREGRVPAILGIKRAELHRVLATRLSALGVSVDLGQTVRAVHEQGSEVGVTFADGTTESFDLMLGADGIRSDTRKLIGLGIEPRYTGFTVWRSVHTRPAELTDKIMMMGPAKRYGIMPISDDKLYTFGTVAEPKLGHIPRADWPGEMRARFAEFVGPASPFLDAIDDTSEVLFTAVEEVVMPLPWHRGRVLLIGDASHASTPFMGQGGAMAMQDAVILAQVLAAADSVPEALIRFGEVRAPVCNFVQDVSRAVGEAGAREDVTDLAARNAGLAAGAQGKVDGFYGELARLNAEAEAQIKGS
jgi:2-polyprenyl-6-methoxyphenol hydroxylase-like FAD-dependent oxidoreductase